MEQKKSKSLSQFELLSENSNGFLISGFSLAVQSNLFGGIDSENTNNKCTINNCDGGNCVKGCGDAGVV